MATNTPEISAGSRLRLHPWVVVREPGRDPLLGCERARRYLEVDDDTLSAIALLEDAPSLAEAEAALRHCTGEEYDVVALAETLAERGFVATVDDVTLDTEPDPAARHPWLYAVPPERLAWLHARRTRRVVWVLALAWLAAVVTDPVLLPRPAHLRFGGEPLVVAIVAFGALLVTAYLHELAHFFVARSYGVDATVRISHRFTIAVLETDVTNAWRLAPRERLVIFGAGSMFNLAVLATTGLLLAGIAHGVLPDPGYGVAAALRVVGYVNFLPLIFQLAFFIRTDLYFALLVATGERNLNAHARKYVRYRTSRLWRRLRGVPRTPCAQCRRTVLYDDDPWCRHCGTVQQVDDPNRWPFGYGSRRRLATFGVTMILGRVLALVYFGTVGIRIQGMLLGLGLTSLRIATHAGDVLGVARAGIFLLLYAGQLAFVAVLLLGTLVRVARLPFRAVARRRVAA